MSINMDRCKIVADIACSFCHKIFEEKSLAYSYYEGDPAMDIYVCHSKPHNPCNFGFRVAGTLRLKFKKGG